MSASCHALGLVPSPRCFAEAGSIGGAQMTIESPADDPQHWRERAEDIRRTTSSIRDPEVKARLLRIANGYEILGRTASRLMRRQCEKKHAGKKAHRS
jgi:hypothetical protein